MCPNEHTAIFISEEKTASQIHMEMPGKKLGSKENFISNPAAMETTGKFSNKIQAALIIEKVLPSGT